MVMQRRCDPAGIVKNPGPTERTKYPAAVVMAHHESNICLPLPCDTLTSKHFTPAHLDKSAYLLEDKLSVEMSHDSRLNSISSSKIGRINNLHLHIPLNDTHLTDESLDGCGNVHSSGWRVIEGTSTEEQPSLKYPSPGNGNVGSLALSRRTSISETSVSNSDVSSISTAASSVADLDLLSAFSCSQRPRIVPSLVKEQARQCSYVDSLVDVATLIVDSLWPCKNPDPQKVSHSTRLLSYFITETSRKSKTSLSTMQLTLFYCIKFKGQQLQRDSGRDSMQVSEEHLRSSAPTHARSVCARRNFLSALILASKYLQDRNFSNKAWSKISSVPVIEINQREREFLEVIQWSLDVKHDVFKNWSDTMETIIVDVQQATILGSPMLCHFKWRHIISKMSRITECQMHHLVLRLAASQSYPSSEPVVQLPTPMLTPTEEYITSHYDFALSDKTGFGTEAHPPPLTPTDNTYHETHGAAAQCQFFDEFVKSTPRDNVVCEVEGMGMIKTSDNAHDVPYATPESLRTSPSSSDASPEQLSAIHVVSDDQFLSSSAKEMTSLTTPVPSFCSPGFTSDTTGRKRACNTPEFNDHSDRHFLASKRVKV